MPLQDLSQGPAPVLSQQGSCFPLVSLLPASPSHWPHSSLPMTPIHPLKPKILPEPSMPPEVVRSMGPCPTHPQAPLWVLHLRLEAGSALQRTSRLPEGLERPAPSDTSLGHPLSWHHLPCYWSGVPARCSDVPMSGPHCTSALSGQGRGCRLHPPRVPLGPLPPAVPSLLCALGGSPVWPGLPRSLALSGLCLALTNRRHQETGRPLTLLSPVPSGLGRGGSPTLWPALGAVPSVGRGPTPWPPMVVP